MLSVKVPAKDGETISALTIGFEDVSIKAAVIISHGFGEHAGSYAEVAEKLYTAGFASIIPNQRGHGLPPENVKNWHGKIPAYQSFIDDIITLTEYVRNRLPETPIALYGHSMGGNIVVNTLLRIPREQAASYMCAVLEAPWLDLYDRPGAGTVIMVRILNVIWPNFRVLNKLSTDDLSTIKEKADAYASDPLYHGYLSARMIAGIVDACQYALDNAQRLPVKTLLASADDDVVVCNKAINKFAGSAGDIVTAKVYESKHAIHNDVSGDAFIDDMIAFMNAVL